jgi:osmoprotectant transport system ATP-binding protein
MMARNKIDSLVVVDDDDKYIGTVTINHIKLHGKEHRTIEPLIETGNVTAKVSDDARQCFDTLLTSGDSYVVVLNDDQTPAGIVTNSSMAKAMADALWGDIG